MEILIAANTGQPIYEQITNQIKAKIMEGEIKSGDSLPSMRALAKMLHISVITVQRAYEDLQRDGFIETTIGRGTVVAMIDKAILQEEAQRQIEESLENAVEIAKRSAISLDVLQSILKLFYERNENI
ncbi:MAG: GntR family transcriptional regulator [Clostridiales bacterium]|nr:GntR family transcriptional regulator [Clostridiales bacterium]